MPQYGNLRYQRVHMSPIMCTSLKNDIRQKITEGLNQVYTKRALQSLKKMIVSNM
jgi:hypothetical protein